MTSAPRWAAAAKEQASSELLGLRDSYLRSVLFKPGTNAIQIDPIVFTKAALGCQFDAFFDRISR